MRELDSRKLLAQLRKHCKANGIEITVVPSGKGSHKAYIFEDAKGEERFRIIFPGKKISPGVQRGSLKYLEELSYKISLAEIVRKILKSIFE